MDPKLNEVPLDYWTYESVMKSDKHKEFRNILGNFKSKHPTFKLIFYKIERDKESKLFKPSVDKKLAEGSDYVSSIYVMIFWQFRIRQYKMRLMRSGSSIKYQT